MCLLTRGQPGDATLLHYLACYIWSFAASRLIPYSLTASSSKYELHQYYQSIGGDEGHCTENLPPSMGYMVAAQHAGRKDELFITRPRSSFTVRRGT